MKWVDGIWWKGLARVIAIDCPEDEGSSYRVVILEKNETKIKEKGQWVFDDLEGVLKEIEKHGSTPILLFYKQAFTVEKVVDSLKSGDLVSSVLGVGVEEQNQISISILPGAEGRALVSLIRKDKAEAAINRFDSFRGRIVDFCFTEGVIQSLASQLESGDGLSNFEICLSGGRNYYLLNGLHCLPMDIHGKEYQRIDEEFIESAHGIQEGFGMLYAAVFALWNKAGLEPDGHLGENLFKHIRNSKLRMTVNLLSALLIVWFVVLFSLRLHGEQRMQELGAKFSQNLPVSNAIHDLDEQISEKRKLKEQLGSQTLKPSRVSFYLDRMALIVPEQITLTEVILGPVEKDFQRLGIIESAEYEMIIRGECTRSAPISLFSLGLENQEWISFANAIKSEYNFMTSKYEFVLLVKLNHA